MATPDQFIVDNTAEDWKALQYVREWCDISSAIDIATGHFEIGAFLASLAVTTCTGIAFGSLVERSGTHGWCAWRR